MERGMLVKSIEEDMTDGFTEKEIEELIERVTGMAILYGAQMKIKSPDFPERVEPMPFTLFPSPIPRRVFQEAKRLHTHFQTVSYKIANNHEFLHDCFKNILPEDEFTQSLWNIYDTVRQEDPNQVLFMIARNDFMMEANPYDPNELCIKQVEMNTVGCGLGGISTAIADTHRYTMSITGIPFTQEQLQDTHPTAGMAEGLYKAWEIYNKPRSVVIFVVEKHDRNAPDQRWVERDLYKKHPHVPVVYRTFEQLLEQTKLSENKELFIGDREVAVVYYWYGYAPKHFPTSKEWELKLTIERSKAIKCPSVGLHLAGYKKVQQVLARPGVLEQFVDDPSVIADMRKTFVRQVELNQNKHLVEKIKQNPDRYVLKPQKEGGGNNLFNEELAGKIDTLYNSPGASSWIVMDKIQGHCHRNRLIRAGLDSHIRNVVSELGFFGVFIGTRSAVLMNSECGHLLRTRPEEAFESGVFCGLGCMDTPFLLG